MNVTSLKSTMVTGTRAMVSSIAVFKSFATTASMRAEWMCKTVSEPVELVETCIAQRQTSAVPATRSRKPPISFLWDSVSHRDSHS